MRWRFLLGINFLLVIGMLIGIDFVKLYYLVKDICGKFSDMYWCN